VRFFQYGVRFGRTGKAGDMAVFEPIDEKDVTRAIVGGFLRQFEEYAESDVIIVGGGPSGLMAGKVLAENGVKTLIIERNNYIGGGF
jgi:thiamine thiazole synthase